MKRIHWGIIAVLVGLLAVTGCRVPGNASAAPQLVVFDSCEAALEGFREAAARVRTMPATPATEEGKEAEEGEVAAEAAPVPRERRPAEAPAAPEAAPQAGSADAGTADAPAAEQPHSKTNNHEAGVEEPDVVQTDGERVVTVADGRLRVVDVASRRQTAAVDLPGGWAEELLLDGDRALAVGGDRVTLIDLAGRARIVSTLEVDGDYVDARMVDGRARLVVRSEPKVPPVAPHEKPGLQDTTIDDWLPSYELSTPTGTSESGRLVACDRVHHPETYRATSMLTLLTVDLQGALGTGDPVTITADGSTVYGTAKNLYVAHDTGGATQLHQFAIAGAAAPEYVASGTVEGTLLNQYAMSEHDGHLRVATITGDDNTVTVLARDGSELEEVGRLGGLGKDERIYAVRFFGPVGYVVTFRETDPLYTLDLHDPARPRAVGELKITGYSAYLHAAGNGRLIGVGQEADLEGRALGIQVSLFDVSDAANPHRLAQRRWNGGTAQVEQEQHAFLFWEPTGLLVLPTGGDALVLRLQGDEFADLGTISAGERVLRSLVIGDELWAVSATGIAVYDEATLGKLASVPFTRG